MTTIKFFIRFIIVITSLLILNIALSAQDEDNDENTQPQPKPTSVIKAQPTMPRYDNRITGEWWTDSKDAIFGKIVFDEKGNFTGYTLTSDIRPYATGTYRIVDGGLVITVNDATMGSTKPTPTVYKYSSYTVSDNKLQLLSETMDKAYNYYKSPQNK